MDAGVKLEVIPGPETQRYSLREAARILEVPESRLRALARAGFLAAQRGPIGPLSFGFQDLLVLRTTKALVEAGVPMKRIRSTWVSRGVQLGAAAEAHAALHDDLARGHDRGPGVQLQPRSARLLECAQRHV